MKNLEFSRTPKMAKIHAKTFPEQDLSLYSIEGNASRQELLQFISNLTKENLTRDIIWDATNGTVEDIGQTDLRLIAEFLKKGHGMRKGSRTALIGPDDLNFGIGRMFQAYAQADNLAVEYKTFRSIDLAMEWFNSPRD